MYTDLESILVLSVGIRKEESKARERGVGNHHRLCRWDCMGDWHGIEEGVGWRQERGIMGMD